MDEAPGRRLHDQQTDAIEQLSALRATIDSQIIGVIRAADESGVWKVDGSPSLAEWVAWRCRLTRAEARRHVEVAAARLGHTRETRRGPGVRETQRHPLRPRTATSQRRHPGAHPGAGPDWRAECDGPVSRRGERRSHRRRTNSREFASELGLQKVHDGSGTIVDNGTEPGT